MAKIYTEKEEKWNKRFDITWYIVKTIFAWIGFLFVISRLW